MAQNPLVGTWRLVSFELQSPDGESWYPFGSAPIGYIIYTADGYMAYQAMAANRARYRTADETVETHFNLGLNVRHADQQLAVHHPEPAVVGRRPAQPRRGDVGQVAEVGLHERGAAAEGGKPLPRDRQDLLVRVEPQQAAIGRAGSKDRAGVSAGADRPVQVAAARTGREQSHDVARQHGDVNVVVVLHAAGGPIDSMVGSVTVKVTAR